MSGARLAANLARNLLGGARLALWPGASWRDFRAGPADYAALVGFNLLAWFVGATLRASGDVRLELSAFAIYLGTVPLVLGCALLVARTTGHPSLGLLLAVALSASDLVVEFASYGLSVLPLPDVARLAAFALFFAWIWAISLRAIVLCTGARGWERLRAFAIVTVVGVALVLGYPRSEPWVAAPGEAGPGPALADEKRFHAQGDLAAAALASVQAGRAGVPELYFVGFAPDGSQDVFLNEMRYVKPRIEARYGAAGRAVALVSNEASLEEFPVATVTNLRRVLGRVAERMNADEDVLMLFVSAHGDRRHDLSAWQPPLEQPPVNPTVLARLLHESGIKWKVIVVSACYAGGFIEPLRDAQTLVIASAAADRQSFGCENGREFTWFGEAFFREGLEANLDLAAAFRLASERVAAREKADGKLASLPQIWTGEQIGAKLADLIAALPR